MADPVTGHHAPEMVGKAAAAFDKPSEASRREHEKAMELHRQARIDRLADKERLDIRRQEAIEKGKTDQLARDQRFRYDADYRAAHAKRMAEAKEARPTIIGVPIGGIDHEKVARQAREDVAAKNRHAMMTREYERNSKIDGLLDQAERRAKDERAAELETPEPAEQGRSSLYGDPRATESWLQSRFNERGLGDGRGD